MPRREKPKILVADRKSPSLLRLARALEAEGYRVETALACEDAREALHRLKPDVLVCSQTLPHGGGYGLCSYLHSQVDPTAASILLMSGNGPEAQSLARKCGADHYLVRPVVPREVSAAVRAMLLVCALRRAQSAEAEAQSSVTDPRTGFYRFDHFKEALFVEVKRSRRYGFPIALMLARYGSRPSVAPTSKLGVQLGGGLALAVRRSIRDTDIPVSYGPDRVMVLMPQTDTAGAALVAKRILFRIAGGSVRERDGRVRPSISIGYAGANHFSANFSDLVKQANRCLEQALERGGNCVVPGVS